MVSSEQAAIAVIIGLIFRGKIPPLIWDEPMMSEILEGEWGEWQKVSLGKSFRRRTLERTADFQALPHYWVRMQLQAVQHESGGRVSTPLWQVRKVEINDELLVVETFTGVEIGTQCHRNGRASIAHLVEAAKEVFQPESQPH